MDKNELNILLQQVAAGTISPDDAALQLKMEPIKEVGEYAKVDMHRGIRQGVPEVIYGAGKTQEHILGIAKAMLSNGQKTVLVTRISSERKSIWGATLMSAIMPRSETTPRSMRMFTSETTRWSESIA